MLSRVAETIFWINRYLERTNNNASFLIVNFNLTLDISPSVEEQWKPLILTMGNWEEFSKKYDTPDRKSVIKFIGFDLDNPSSIYSCAKTVRENARTIRENISLEIWEQINELYFYLKSGAEGSV